MEVIYWIGILICLSQSGMLSGLNLAFFNISKLKLELEEEKNNKKAMKILKLREDTNFLLVTILWANVSVNVILALLSGSVLGGIAAFLFSTVVITIVGEIIPQAYFSRNAIKIASSLTPLLKFYQILLYPIAKPIAAFLDHWLGKEAIAYYKEKDLRELIKLHMNENETEIQNMEGQGTLNFLRLDDLSIIKEGESIDPESIIQLEFRDNLPLFPDIESNVSNSFLKNVQKSNKKWVILVDQANQPQMVIDSDKFLISALFDYDNFSPLKHCHRPIIVTDETTSLKQVIPKLRVDPEHLQDDVVDKDIILVWNKEKKVITGSDILGPLLRGIVKNKPI